MSDVSKALFRIVQQHLGTYALNESNAIHVKTRAALLQELQELSTQEKQDALLLYHTTPLTREEFNALCESLCVSASVYEKLPTPSNLFAALQILGQHQYGHGHLDDFHHLLASVKYETDWTGTLMLYGLLGALSGALLYLTNSVVLLMSAYSALSIIWQAQTTWYGDEFKSPFKRFERWLVGTLVPLLSLLSYGLYFAASGVFTPLATGLFIASSLVDVVDALFNIWSLPRANTPTSPTQLEQLDHLRAINREERKYWTTLIKLVAAILVSATITLWCLYPPSLAVVVGYILFLNLVKIAKTMALDDVHEHSARDLQDKIGQSFFATPDVPDDSEPDDAIGMNEPPPADTSFYA